MNATTPNREAPDELDKLFSDFFKAQFKHPWPNAPLPAAGSAMPASEPSGLLASRADAPRNAPVPRAKVRDGSARARFTLAASVALALGACWVLSNGLEPGARPNGSQSVPGLLPDSGAKDQGVLPTIEKNKATGDTGGLKIDLGKEE